MALIIVLAVLLGAALFALLSPLRLEIDTRIPAGRLQWHGIGTAELFYDQEWKAAVRIFFWRKLILLERITSKSGKKPAAAKRKMKSRANSRRPFPVLFKKAKRVLQSFTVEYWQLALDTGDHTMNAKLYPLNWLPGTRGHVDVNFTGENYFRCRIRNRGWKLLYAWFR